MKADIEIVFDLSEEVARAIHAEAMTAIADAVQLLETEAKEALNSGPKTGRIYKRGKKEHQASAPGEAPATDTGNLAGSIEPDLSQIENLVGEVVVSAEYAAIEFGTTTIAPRPYITPAAKKAAKQLQKDLNKAVGNG